MKLRTLVVALGLLGPAALTQAQTQPQPLPDLLGRPVEVAPPASAASPAETRQKAMEGLLAKAQAGDRDATYQLAEMMLEERTPQGHEAALELLSSLATNGDLPALRKMEEVATSGAGIFQQAVAGIYLLGIGHPANTVKAKSYLQMAADQGIPNAIAGLAIFYAQGITVQRDLNEAERLLIKAASLGDVEAMRGLGELLMLPELGARKNEAIAWVRKAAVRGDMISQYKLGEAYLNGEGVAGDSQKAAIWMRKAAEQGHFKAQFALGALLQGLGKSVEAYAWISLSSEVMEGAAIERRLSELKAGMSASERMKADQLRARLQRYSAADKLRSIGMFEG